MAGWELCYLCGVGALCVLAVAFIPGSQVVQLIIGRLRTTDELREMSSRLNSKCREIRILTLLPGEQESPIYCTLYTISLATLLWRPEYDALSYAWGDTNLCRKLYLNGNEHAVTPNLEIALKHLRHRREKRLLWIDALCISQTDVIEKNEQVSMMDDIFSSARTVFLWIGEADQWTDGAFGAMSLLSSYRIPISTTLLRSSDWGTQEARESLVEFYRALSCRPWFSRVWTLQEMALARRDPVVMCGHKSIAWTSFADTLEKSFPRLQESELEVGAALPTSMRITLRKRAREHVLANDTNRLLTLLQNTPGHEATDARDHIYALLGMLHAAERWDLLVDYRKSTPALYTEVTTHLIKQGCGINFLLYIETPNPTTSIYGLPSWVPDFSGGSGKTSAMTTAWFFVPPGGASASGAHDSARQCPPGFRDVKTLETGSWLIDTVEDVLKFGPNLSTV